MVGRIACGGGWAEEKVEWVKGAAFVRVFGFEFDGKLNLRKNIRMRAQQAGPLQLFSCVGDGENYYLAFFAYAFAGGADPCEIF